jgi:hypothetical protein
MDSRIKECFGAHPVLFVKFSDNIEHLKSLQQGNLYMNNLKYFVELEEKTGIPGMGDKMEALNVINDIEVSFYKLGTDHLITKAKAKKANFRYEDALFKPVYCLFAITADMLVVHKETELDVELKINFTEEQKSKMTSEFGKYALVISPPHFSERLRKSFNEKGHEFSGKYVDYIDNNVNEQRRIEAFANPDTRMFFFKDHGFKHQNEFRIVIFNKDEESAILENIGELQDCSSLLKTEDLFTSDTYILNVHLKNEKESGKI